MRNSPIARCAIIVGAVAGLSLLLCALVVDAPSVWPDELGYLLNGQILLGRHEVFIPFARFYSPIYGAISGIGALVTGSLRGAYRFDLIVNVSFSLLAAGLCVRIARRMLGAPREVALLAGLIVLVSPGGFDGALFAWAESLARLVILVMVVLVWRAATTPSTSRLVTLAVVAGMAPLVHGRFGAVVAATFALLLVWGIGRHAKVMSVAIAGMSLVSVYAVGRVGSSVMRGWLYRGGNAREVLLLRRLVNPGVWTDVVRETGGQIWYALAASIGLILVAVVWMVRQSLGRPGRIVNASKTGLGAMSLFALSIGSLIILLGSLQLTRAVRADQFIYGRHVESFMPIFLVVAVVEVSKVSRRLNRTWLIGSVSIIAISVVYTIAQRQDIVRQWVIQNGPMKTANVLGVDAMADVVGTEGLISLGVGFTVVALVIVILHKRVGNWAMLGFAVMLLVSSVYTSRTTLVDRPWMYRAIGDTSGLIDGSRSVTVGFDGRTLHDKRYFALRYLVHPAQLRWLDVVDGKMSVPESINCIFGHADRIPDDTGWQIADREDGIDRVLWIRVGKDRC